MVDKEKQIQQCCVSEKHGHGGVEPGKLLTSYGGSCGGQRHECTQLVSKCLIFLHFRLHFSGIWESISQAMHWVQPSPFLNASVVGHVMFK